MSETLVIKCELAWLGLARMLWDLFTFFVYLQCLDLI